jgi:soluble lytic murein transglycosylase-like protein
MTWQYLSQAVTTAILGVVVSLSFPVRAGAESGEGGSVILPHEFEDLQSAAVTESETSASGAENTAPESVRARKIRQAAAGAAKKGLGSAAASVPLESGGDKAKTRSPAVVPEAQNREEEAGVAQTSALPQAQISGKPGGTLADAARAGSLAPLIARYASENHVPFELADAVVRLESRYNVGARNGPNLGLTQVNLRTAQSLGYKGDAAGLLDAETNLQYGLKYLAQAYRLAGGDTCGTILRYQFGHRTQAMTKASRIYCSKVTTIMAAAE